VEDELTSELIADADPFELFKEWFMAARRSEPNDGNAMALATTAADGRPSVRMVLLKGHDRSGFTFYTSNASRKGRELEANSHVALLFHWKSLRRQIRIEGTVLPVAPGTADAYFANRARDSQLGAIASSQSAPLVSRAAFLSRFEAVRREFAGRDVKRPAYWMGYRVCPHEMEFWLDRPHRLHERRKFTREDDGWTSSLLYP
jgi:pyridoxamine 5'-phosphate oxidase